MAVSNAPELKGKKWYKHWLFYTSLSVIIIGFLYFGGNYWMNCLIDKRHTEINKTIRQILIQEAQSDILLPDVVLINSKGKLDTSLNTKIKTQLADFLSAKYLSGKEHSSGTFDLQPYLTVFDKQDSIITPNDVAQIKKHIEFLANTVDKAVEASKHDIDIEIAKINTWVTIWIGIIGVIGIFLPIVINIKSLEDLKNIKVKTKEAKKNADKVKAEMEKYEPQLKALPELIIQVGGFEEKITKQEKRIGSLDSQYTEIEKKATKAETESLNTQKLLTLINSVFKLKDIDGNFLIYNKEPLNTLVKYLEDIHIELTRVKADYNNAIIKDSLRQLAMRLYLLSYYAFVSKDNIKQLNQMSLSITERLESGFSETSFQLFLDELNSMISNLKPS